MCVYSISYETESAVEVRAVIEEVLSGSKAIQFNDDCWFLETSLSKSEVTDTLRYIAELNEPFCTVTRMNFGDWLQKAYTPEVIAWLTHPLRNW